MKHSILKYFIHFVFAVALCITSISCDDSDDRVYEMQTVYYVKCNTAVNLRKTPEKNGTPIRALKKDTEVATVEDATSEWYKVTTFNGETGYMPKRYIDTKTVNKFVRMKNDIDDLNDMNQELTIYLVESYNSLQRKTSSATQWTIIIICTILTFINGGASLIYLDGSGSESDSTFPLWITYLLTLANGGLLLYFLLFIEPQSIDIHWILSILCIIGFLIGIALMWASLMSTSAMLMNGSTSAIIHTVGTIIGIVLSTACGFWFESFADFFIFLTIAWNIVFLIIYLYEAIKHKSFSRFLAIVVLWAVCIIPYILLSVYALQIVFVIACILFGLFALAMPSGSKRRGEYIIDGSRVVTWYGSDECKTADGRMWERGSSGWHQIG